MGRRTAMAARSQGSTLRTAKQGWSVNGIDLAPQRETCVGGLETRKDIVGLPLIIREEVLRNRRLDGTKKEMSVRQRAVLVRVYCTAQAAFVVRGAPGSVGWSYIAETETTKLIHCRNVSLGWLRA